MLADFSYIYIRSCSSDGSTENCHPAALGSINTSAKLNLKSLVIWYIKCIQTLYKAEAVMHP